MQHVRPFQVKCAEDDGGWMTWTDGMQIFGAWTPLSGIQTDAYSYITSPNHRDKIIEIDDAWCLLQVWRLVGVRRLREMPKQPPRE